MLNRPIIVILSLIICLPFCAAARGQKAPRPQAELERLADAVVVGTITEVECESHASTIERGSGNTDWWITLTVEIGSIEIGSTESEAPTQEPIRVRCVRIRSRKSMLGFLSLTGHYPIPSRGTVARFYLIGRADGWDVLMPNGIVPIGDNGDTPESSVREAQEVVRLGRPRYSYFLPIEIWGALLVSVAALLFAIRLYRWRRTADRAASEG